MAEAVRFLIIGGGPAGTTAATVAASLGARVTLVEQSVVGGAAHLWDCIPSKTMTATAIRIDSIRNAANLGLVATPGTVDVSALAERIRLISGNINRGWVDLLISQDVEIILGQVGSLVSRTGGLVGQLVAGHEGDRDRLVHRYLDAGDAAAAGGGQPSPQLAAGEDVAALGV